MEGMKRNEGMKGKRKTLGREVRREKWNEGGIRGM